jgi:serine/threonine-protein kinase
VVHRDVKAGNVMVGEGDPPRVKLLDFGIAKVTDPSAEGLTRAGERLGTFCYMSPEQLQCRPVDARTDVYAVGVLLYQMLTGRLPFVGDDPAAVERMHIEAPPPRPSLRAPVPAAFDAVVARCLAKSPEDRYPSAGALALALRAAAGLSGSEGGRAASAIHVSFASEAADDDGMAGQASALEAVEAALREHGFAVPLMTANALLALRLLPEAADAAGPARAEALALARRLPGIGLEAAGAASELVVWVHAGSAVVEGDEVIGGEVCRPEGWAAPAPPGVHATAAASSGAA